MRTSILPTLLLVLTLAATLVSPAPAATYLVRPDGTGHFPTIQAAISASVDGDRIVLADGTFVGAGNYGLEFGGRAITVASQSGNPAACVINCLAQGRGVYFRAGDGTGTVLEGVTITGGVAPGGGLDIGGGGIRCDGGSPTITNCVILANSTGRYGGGARFDHSNPTFRGCVFLSNDTSEGGGGFCAMDASEPVFEDCRFETNHGWVGGGAYLLDDASATFRRCTFVGNSSNASGGGLQSSDSPGATLIDCEFYDNVANSEGGAISWSGTVTGGSALVLQRCTVVHNTAVMAYAGGAYVIAPQGTLIVENCTFHENSGLTAGGLYVHSNNTAVHVSNTIISASAGLPAYFWGPALEISCCDFFGNSDGDWPGQLAPYFGVDGNIALDPRYCSAGTRDLTLRADSPCAPFTPPNPECDLIGAWPVACEPTPVVETSWGVVKHRFLPAR